MEGRLVSSIIPFWLKSRIVTYSCSTIQFTVNSSALAKSWMVIFVHFIVCQVLATFIWHKVVYLVFVHCRENGERDGTNSRRKWAASSESLRKCFEGYTSQVMESASLQPEILQSTPSPCKSSFTCCCWCCCLSNESS